VYGKELSRTQRDSPSYKAAAIILNKPCNTEQIHDIAKLITQTEKTDALMTELKSANQKLRRHSTIHVSVCNKLDTQTIYVTLENRFKLL